MGIWLIFQNLLKVTKADSCLPLLDWVGSVGLPGNSFSNKTVPQTDTGGQVEYTKALERMVLKELGNLPP